MSATTAPRTTSQAGHRAGFQTQDHEVAIDRLPVEGSFPAWLGGALVRNGPAQFEVGSTTFNHWFDGLAMLHAFSFSGGHVGYRNRFVRSAAYEGASAARSPTRSSPPTRAGRSSGAWPRPSRGVDAGNPNVNVVRIGDEFLALTETPIPVEFDPETLETLGVVDAPRRAPGQITIAHPHQDPVTGELVSYAANLGRKTVYNVYAQKPGERPRDDPVDPGQGPVLHAQLRDHRAPRGADRVAAAREPDRRWPLGSLRGRPFIENYEWKPELGTRIHVVDLRDGSAPRHVRGGSRLLLPPRERVRARWPSWSWTSAATTTRR